MACLENLPLGWSQTLERVRVLVNHIYLSKVTHAQLSSHRGKGLEELPFPGTSPELPLSLCPFRNRSFASAMTS